MPGYKIIVNPVNVIYVYDGSFAGFLCCVHESVYAKELPADIVSEANYAPNLYEQKLIKTDEQKALKVQSSIAKVSERTLQLTKHGFLCHHENKELKLLKFLVSAFREGAKAAFMLGNPEVSDVLDMEKHMLRESHLLKGFIRFADYGDTLAAVITAKNFVLPLLVNHFVSRFPNENFMIYDKTHKALLVYQDRKVEIMKVEEIEFAKGSEEELKYQALWKNFYDTIGIKERLNPKCRMTLMPKRYWGNMVEMRGEV